MNRERRRRVSKILRSYRVLKKQTPEQVAATLGWPLTMYLKAEAGTAALSEGQQEDVRRILKKAVGKL